MVHLAGEPSPTRAGPPSASSSSAQPRRDDPQAGEGSRRDAQARVFISGSAVGIYGMRLDDVVLRRGDARGSDVLARIGLRGVGSRGGAGARRGRARRAPRIGIVLGADGGALAKMRQAVQALRGGPLRHGQAVGELDPRQRRRARARSSPSIATSLTGPFNLAAPEPVDDERLREGPRASALGRPSRLRVPALALRPRSARARPSRCSPGRRVKPGRLLEERVRVQVSTRLERCAVRAIGPLAANWAVRDECTRMTKASPRRDALPRSRRVPSPHASRRSDLPEPHERRGCIAFDGQSTPEPACQTTTSLSDERLHPPPGGRPPRVHVPRRRGYRGVLRPRPREGGRSATART